MYECPNCGGNLRFNIATQQLSCGYCDTSINPYDYEKSTDVQESREYDVTVFTCSQCGAELLSEDTTAATFCSFCGSTAVLDSRISRKRRPERIIPFSRTKEDCKTAYARMMRRAVFAPKELKDEAYIEKFRGIYMPYWVYSFENRGRISFEGSESRQRGDYLYTKHYEITSDIDAAYHGITYDAAADFSDDLSSAIAPFDMTKGKPFTPAFLSGFYADIGDVDSSVYHRDAQNLALMDSVDRIANDRACVRYHVRDGKNIHSLKNALRPSCTREQSAMLPVWFLSYRKGDRVAYAVVNGQTGKAAADLPVDRKKFVIGSLLLAIPLFLFLNLRFTITPAITLIFSALLACVCTAVSVYQMIRISVREAREDDKGFVFAQQDAGKQGSYGNTGNNGKGKKAKVRVAGIDVSRILIIVLLIGVINVGGFVRVVDALLGGIILSIVYWTVIVGVVIAFILKKYMKTLKGALPVLIKPMAAVVLAVAVLIWHPVSDLYYYGGAVISMGAIVWTLMDIIGRYNVLSTRKLPQLNRRGGDL